MAGESEAKDDLNASAILQLLAKPVVLFLVYVVPVVITAVRRMYQLFSKLPTNCVHFLIGAVACFFGGMFPSLFAAVQAAEYGGRKKFVDAMSDLADETMKVIEASKKDDDVDDDQDGKKDVDQLSGSLYMARKTKLVLKKMNPEKLNTALGSLYSVWLTVAAVLKIEFARVISMALAIADFLNKPADRFIRPVLNVVIPDEYEKWTPVVLGWITKTIAITFAWYIQSVVSAATSALKGGLMMARATLQFCVYRNWSLGGLIPEDHNKTNVDEFLSYLFAGLGFYFQFKMGFDLPFPLNLILLPFDMAEKYIRWTITE